MVSISVVVSAPKGISECAAVQEFLPLADGESLELVVADGASGAKAQSRPGLRHILMPGHSVFSLRCAGIAQSTKDWVVVTEDHCRPMPGMLQAFQAAIRDHPDVDLFSGALTNVTSTSPWEWANFLNFRFRYWPPANEAPKQPTIGNLAVRRDAILASELVHEGGFDVLTIKRLSRPGRHMFCRESVVDHVERLSWTDALVRQFHAARSGGFFARRMTPWSYGALLIRIFGVPIHRIFILPARTLYVLRGTPQAHWSLLFRLMLIGAFGWAGWTVGYFIGPGPSLKKVG